MKPFPNRRKVIAMVSARTTRLPTTIRPA